MLTVVDEAQLVRVLYMNPNASNSHEEEKHAGLSQIISLYDVCD